MLIHDGVTLQWTNCCIVVEWSLTHKAKDSGGFRGGKGDANALPFGG